MTNETPTPIPTSINADLVRRYHETGDIKNLLTLFDYLWKCKERAESLSRAYLAQMTRQQTTTQGRPLDDRPERRPPTPKPATSDIIDLDL